MARGNYPACKAITLVWEGGTVNHPSDPGGFTSRGVTAGAGASYRRRKGLPAKAVDKWTAAEVDAFYHDDYWLGVNADKLPWGVDLGTFDYGVNSGPSRAGKELQRVVGVKADGQIGPDTLRAVAAMKGDAVVKALCGRRLSFVRGLGTFKVFGKGWSRRIADIEARGVAMWLRNGAGKSAGETADQMAREAEAASGKSAGQAKGAATAGAGGAGGGVVDMASGGTGWLLALVAVVVVVGVVLMLKSRQNSARAAAYGAVMGEQAIDEMTGR